MAVNILIAWVLIAIFTGLSLIHVYWLCGGRVGQLAAIPETDGKPIFEPSALATLVPVCLVDGRHCWDTPAIAVSDSAQLADPCLGSGLTGARAGRLPIGGVL